MAKLMVSLSVMVMPFLPATNLLFYVGFVVAERVLYIPSIGFCLLLGHAMAKMCNGRQYHQKRKMAAICALVILLTCFGLKTLRRNQDWKDEERLYMSGIPINPAKGEMTEGLSQHES